MRGKNRGDDMRKLRGEGKKVSGRKWRRITLEMKVIRGEGGKEEKKRKEGNVRGRGRDGRGEKARRERGIKG